MWHVMTFHDLIFIQFFVVKSTNDKIYVHFKQRRFFVPFALILEFLVSCVTDGFESMALTPEGRWNVIFVGAELHPKHRRFFFMTQKNQSQVFFSKKLGKTSFQCPSIDTGWQNRASNLGFLWREWRLRGRSRGCHGCNSQKSHQNDATLGQLIRFNEMEEKIIYTFCWNHKKPWVFWQTQCKDMGCKSL